MMIRYYKKIYTKVYQTLFLKIPPIQPIASQPLGDCEKILLLRYRKKGIFQ